MPVAGTLSVLRPFRGARGIKRAPLTHYAFGVASDWAFAATGIESDVYIAWSWGALPFVCGVLLV